MWTVLSPVSNPLLCLRFYFVSSVFGLGWSPVKALWRRLLCLLQADTDACIRSESRARLLV